VSEEVELEIHDPVDEVPGAPSSRRGSKWDAVIDQAAENPGKWIPVTKPRTFTATTANWLRERCEELLVEVRTDKVYLNWDPGTARELRIASTSEQRKREHDT
jgi:hypothetical protein